MKCAHQFSEHHALRTAAAAPHAPVGIHLREWLRVAGVIALALFLFIGISAGRAFAASDEDGDEDSVKTVHAASGEKVHRRQYPGGRDEEDLTVQTSLPQPVRSPDGVPGAPDASAAAHD